ncbi:MAG: Maf family protein [Acetatifactor sp.]|nr:Maf family protein [Acetatifactor sp.]
MRIVLASASPRRRELLEQIGLKFEVSVSNVPEQISAGEPWHMVEELSSQKAEAVFKQMEGFRSDTAEETDLQEEVLVVGADTVVSAEGSILGKPADGEDAAGMLAMLSGRSHEVYTGVTLIYRSVSGQIQRKTFYERTEVVFYPMSRAEIECYVSTGDCMDKAGAYGIQGFCARYIKEIRGDYNNVVGLPVGRLYQEAKEWLGE